LLHFKFDIIVVIIVVIAELVRKTAGMPDLRAHWLHLLHGSFDLKCSTNLPWWDLRQPVILKPVCRQCSALNLTHQHD